MEIGIVVGVLLVLIAGGVPIAFSLGIASVVGVVLVYHGTAGLAQISGVSLDQLDFVVAALPLYVLLGELLLFCGAGAALFRAAAVWLRRVRGGMGVATIVGSAMLAAVNGSSTASIVTLGRVAIDEMKAAGYHPRLALGALAASGTLGILIPPSISLILYSAATGVSLGKLFEAGFIPGLLLTVMMAAYMVLRGAGDRSDEEPTAMGVDAPATDPRPSDANGAAPYRPSVTRVERAGPVAVQAGSGKAIAPAHALGRASGHGGGAAALQLDAVAMVDGGATSTTRKWEVAWATAMSMPGLIGIAVVLGSVYSGVATPTESAGLGIVYALILCSVTVVRRRNWTDLKECLRHAAMTSSMMMLIVVMAGVFSHVLVLLQVPQQVASALLDLPVGRWGVFVLVMAILTLLGLFINPGSIILIVIPIVYPTIESLGFDGVWFGIVTVMNMELATIHPPIGVNLFVLRAVSKAPTTEIVKAVIPYWGIVVAAIVIVAAVPEIALFLPSVFE